jgi:hypothetical protein
MSRQPIDPRATRLLVAILLAAALFPFSFTLFHSPTASAAPATRPTSDIGAQLKTWFVNLAHPDARVRNDAMVQLMGIRAVDLPILRRVVEESRPLAAEQAVALRQIVTQVYLANDPYDHHEDGFLGVFLPQPNTDDFVDGTLVTKRMPGFVGMRMFRDGDVILEIIDPARHTVHSGRNLTDALKNMPAGKTLQFQVLRQGQVILIPVTLDQRPLEADNGPEAMEEFSRLRMVRADQYWTAHFANLVQERVS